MSPFCSGLELVGLSLEKRTAGYNSKITVVVRL